VYHDPWWLVPARAECRRECLERAEEGSTRPAGGFEGRALPDGGLKESDDLGRPVETVADTARDDTGLEMDESEIQLHPPREHGHGAEQQMIYPQMFSQPLTGLLLDEVGELQPQLSHDQIETGALYDPCAMGGEVRRQHLRKIGAEAARLPVLERQVGNSEPLSRLRDCLSHPLEEGVLLGYEGRRRRLAVRPSAWIDGNRRRVKGAGRTSKGKEEHGRPDPEPYRF